MIEQIVLGTAQGIAEWLPVSSEAIITLIKINLFPSGAGLFDTVKMALFLHLGTALAAIVYFRKDITVLLKDLFSYKSAREENKKVLLFLIISTIISGLLGLVFLKILQDTQPIETSGRVLTTIVGVMLLITAGLQLLNKKTSEKKTENSIKTKDGVILGITQGLATIPGLSRSGTTVAALLLLGFDKKTSLRLSFLMSIPFVLAGNIVLNIGKIQTFSYISLIGLATSFIFGIITINILLKMAQKINFGYFVLFFAILTLISVII